MFENMASQVLTEHLYNRSYVPPIGEAGDPRLLNEFYMPSATLDGYINLSANTNDQVFALFEEIGRPELKTDPRFSSVAARFQNTQLYYQIRTEGLRQHTSAHWLEVFRRRDVPASPYHTLETLVDDPHLADVGLLREREHPTEGTVIDIEPANTIASGSRTDWLPAPRLGEHTDAILREAGFDDHEIAALLAEGAARAAPADA